MDESLSRTLRHIAALIADVFPFIALRWDPDEPGCFSGDIGKFFTIEVAPVLEEDVNGHIIDVFFCNKDWSDPPLETFQLPGEPNWEKFESWLMEKVYREIIMEAAKILDACGIDFPLPPLAVKHGIHNQPVYVRPSGRAWHLIEMSDVFWTGAALIGGPAGSGKTTVALHIASAALNTLGSVHIVHNEMEAGDFSNNFAGRFPVGDKELPVHNFDTEGKADDVFERLVTWVKDLGDTKMVILDDTILTKKIQERLCELSRRTGVRILAVAQVDRKTDSPTKWAKKLGDEADALGAVFWVEWGDRKDLGQLYVVKHGSENGPRLLPVTIQR